MYFKVGNYSLFPVLFGQIEEGVGSVGETFDEAAVEVSESEKGLHLLPVAWLWPVDHG